MESRNPYAPPNADVADATNVGSDSVEQLDRIAAGQHLVIVSLLFSLAAQVLGRTAGAIGLLAILAAFIFSVVSVVRLARALGIPVVSQVLLSIGLILPLISLAILAILNSRATRRLRAAGY